ncbi:NUDIX hydrolase [Paraburkholderia phenoliruptrix]|uniref:NUDIX hydrolase n=1 Tax=Paraburkholderia phenoliruptrix TaxID=252970 RepID=UPI0039B4954F
MKQRATVICERDGNVLLVARERGRWAFPGGRQKIGEDIASTAIRELGEETGLQVSSSHYLFQFRGLRTRHFVFIVRLTNESEPVPSNEIARCRWVKPQELAKLDTSIPTKGIAEIFLRQSRGSRQSPDETAQALAT